MKIFIMQFNRTVGVVLTISVFILATEGCSTVYFSARQASKADDIYSKTVFALWWGIDDPDIAVDCKGEGLQFVKVKSNWFYSICSFITLGAVVPFDVEYRCTSIPLQNGGDIGKLEE